MRTRLVELDTPWRDAAYAVVDLETTGLRPRRDEIISFASVPVEQGRIVVGGTVTALIRPRRMPPAETIRIHGLRSADLEHAPALHDSLDVILAALSGRVLVAHAAWVETGFLSKALKSVGARPRGPVLDTAVIARGLSGGASGLGATARRFGLPVHRPHHADGDALTTAQLFIALAAKLESREPQTVGSLARLSTPAR